MSKTIETEYKLELSKEEFEEIKRKLDQENNCLGLFELKDYFFDIDKFDEKKWNFTRIRVYNDTRYEKTAKIWKLNQAGDKFREETESVSNQAELEEWLRSKKYLNLKKTRIDYKQGQVLGFDATVSIDQVIFPDEERYFIECELKGVSADESQDIRPRLRQWMLDQFNLSDRPEGIGMMSLVLSKV